jgi:hypothetical protein
LNGPNATNTLAALTTNRNALQNVLAQRSALLNITLDYDCPVFDKDNLCISYQARYTSLAGRNGGDSTDDAAGVFTVAYRLSPELRLGGFMDFRLRQDAPTNLKYGDDLPSFGLFLGYTQNADGTGLQGRISGAYQRGEVSITRSNGLENTEPGSGKATLTSRVLGGEIGWGFAMPHNLIATPFLGMRYTEASRSAYSERTEAGTVDYPISYSDFHQQVTTANLGLRLRGALTEAIGWQLGGGAEYDLRRDANTYNGTSSIPDLTSFALASADKANRLRPFAMAGTHYQLGPNQRLTANLIYREQAYTAEPSITALAGIQVAF